MGSSPLGVPGMTFLSFWRRYEALAGTEEARSHGTCNHVMPSSMAETSLTSFSKTQEL
jgi:hypothetical protein